MVAEFRQGLKQAGYVEGQNVVIEYRWAGGQYHQLPVMAAELIHHPVAVLAATSTPAALAAKAATTTVPTVFTTASDPVQLGLVASLSRPGGNITGVSQLNVELGRKRLELARELLSTATIVGLLVNPANPIAETLTQDLRVAAQAIGLKLHVVHASNERDFDSVFATLSRLGAGGLVISPDVFFVSRREQLGALTLQHAVPTIWDQGREFATAGGLISYGASVADSYRLAGVYTGRILKGEKPSDLPVQQSTKIELIVNLRTAKALGLNVPELILARADEVIE